MSKAKIILKTKKDRSIRRYHPWVFSGAIKKMQGEPSNGDLVDVYANNDDLLGTGHYQEGSIAVRMLSFDGQEIEPGFWKARIVEAYKRRVILGLTDNEHTNAYRLVHAEGDQLPGLIIDFYNGVAVMQMHSVGMHMARTEIVEGLQEAYGEKLIAIYDKSSVTLAKSGLTVEDGYVMGTCTTPHEVLENGNRFMIDWVTGQKTGFFLDQRDNRALLRAYSKGKKVLNTFCYSGGFSVYALQAGAEKVDSLDSSAKAMELTDENVALNFGDDKRHTSIKADAMDYLKELEQDYDVVVLDPPAFAKHRNARHQAVQGYKRLNAHAIRQIKPGGIIFTFSCSQVVDKELFNHTIVSAAISAERQVKILHQLHQPADHPINAFHSEGEYLKGLVLLVE